MTYSYVSKGEKTYLSKQLSICRIYTVSLFGLPPWAHLYQAPSVSSAGQTLTDTGDRKLLLHAYSVPPDSPPPLYGDCFSL